MGNSSSSITQPADRTSYALQNPFATVEESYTEDHGACCLYKVRRPPIKKDLNWKDYMIEQLKLVDLEEWPSILLKQLVNYQDPLTDTHYRIKAVEAKLSRPGAEMPSEGEQQIEISGPGLSNASQMLVRKRSSNPFAVNASMSNSRMVNKRDTKDVNTSIKQLLDTSDILDEKIYPTCYRDLLDTIKAEQRTGINISGLPDLSKYSNELNISRPGPVEANNISAHSNRNFQTYQNNTIISQLGPVYKMQAHNNAQDLDAARTETCLLYYKQVTGMIESHLKQDRNIFKQLIRSFEGYFVKKYQSFSEDVQDMEQLSAIIQSATKDLQYFIRILCDGITLYYDLQNLYRGKLSTGYSMFNYDNMSNFLTTIVFNEKIYNLIFSLYELENYETEQNYLKQLDSLQKLSPQDFGVTEEYCLDEQTIEFFRKRDSIPNEQKNLLGLELNLAEELLSPKMIGFSDRQDPGASRVPVNLKKKAYYKAISALKALAYQKSPIHKSKSILKTIEMVGISIDEFYEEFSIKSQRSLTGDHTFNILCYVIVNSGVKSVLSHCRIINEFSTSNMMSSISGYYASTLEVCVQYLCNLPVQDIEASE